MAWQLARQAGQRLLSLRTSGEVAAEALRDAGDQLSHSYLMAELARLRPDDAVLSEEGADDPARLSSNRVWIVDPLDGTREFGEPGRTDWAVHVALWADGDLAAGAVALPAEDRVLSTWRPEPTPRPPDPDRLRLLVSRSRPPAFVARLVTSLGAVEVPMGSAGAKVAAVITGQADAYVHSGGQFEWDSAAPVAAARAAGLHASRIDGSALRYNQANPYLPDILVCPVEVAPRLLSAIATATITGDPVPKSFTATTAQGDQF
ncbi:MAG: 3'(2'),5'-bisphosphate nucleotidase CysQ [Actinobacteria bacterium]|nr:3'(2'),5'-bisphosphate nucleotidase CysQ [Actinomycetota bacterium]